MLVSSGFSAKQGHLERQQHLTGSPERIVGQRRIAGGIAQGVERNAKAGFGLHLGDRFIVGHFGVIAHADH